MEHLKPIYPGNQGALLRLGEAPAGASFAKDSKTVNSGKTMDLKDVECFKCHMKGHYANKCPNAKAKVSVGRYKRIHFENYEII